MKKISKVLIANRGEIALRIHRSMKEMGINTVAIYSEPDRMTPHVRYADEAVFIGEALSTQSYLDMDKIVAAALRCQADAIHPGYGFLSENADFAQKVQDAGLIFIGPPPEAIRSMGSKLEAKKTAAACGVPMIPGCGLLGSNDEEVYAAAKQIGFPVLIKASAGGGGKGMRIVQTEEELPGQLQRAASEAQSAFGDGTVFIEKYITSPKHIEIQILGDQHGHYVYLFERECSIQRRYQKVVEEAPSPAISPDIRAAMGAAAIAVARGCGYYGAGTVEFILDEQKKFYFLEMNTRLQVEHPVTEFITGIDLVKEQIRIAEGHPLAYTQEELSIRGHAIELRVYAEDPEQDFMPAPGIITRYKAPMGPGVRVDDCVEKGSSIPIYYDPLIAKLTVSGSDREEALCRMIRAIDEYDIAGVATTLPFGKYVMKHPVFQDGSFDTHFVKHHFSKEKISEEELPEDVHRLAALLAGYLVSEEKKRKKPVASLPISDKWKKRRY
jgi:acetyl-CoA carboxylase biotin carboxylase subunit